MQAVAPIDFTALVATIMGISVVLIPVIGLTARFALKPTVEAFSQFFQAKTAEESVRLLERRMALLESQMENIDASMNRIAQVSEFHHQLSTGEGPAEPPSADKTAST